MLGRIWNNIFGGGGKDKVKPFPTPSTGTVTINWEEKFYVDTRAFTIKDVLDQLPGSYSTDNANKYLLGWVFNLPENGKIRDIVIEAILAEYLPGEGNASSNFNLSQPKLPGAVVRPYNVRQRRVPVDCGVPHGMEQSPAAQVLSETSSFPSSLPLGIEIPQMEADKAQTEAHVEAEELCEKTISPLLDAKMTELDQHRPWVGRIIFSATDLLYMHYLLKTQSNYQDIVFSGALIDYRDMLNSKSRIEQFSTTSDRFPDVNKKVLVPNPSRVFTFKAELTGDAYPVDELPNKNPANQRKGNGQEVEIRTESNDDTSPPDRAPAVFLGIPCPTYWEEMDAQMNPQAYVHEMNFLHRELARFVPAENGQWQGLIKLIKPADIEALHQGETVTYQLRAPLQT